MSWNDTVEALVQAFENGSDAEITRLVMAGGQAERRERIATAVLAGFAVNENEPVDTMEGETDEEAVARAQRVLAKAAVDWADALIAELDK